MIIIPKPQLLINESGCLNLQNEITATNIKNAFLKREINNIFKGRTVSFLNKTCKEQPLLKLSKCTSLEVEEYSLNITSEQIEICYAMENGLFYALSTLAQIASQSENSLPCNNNKHCLHLHLE